MTLLVINLKRDQLEQLYAFSNHILLLKFRLKRDEELDFTKLSFCQVICNNEG